MLATINVTSANREPAGSRLSHSIARPATSFLIRDILGKCENDLSSSDNEEHSDSNLREPRNNFKQRNSSRDEREKTAKFRETPSPESNPDSQPTLCCRECIKGSTINDNHINEQTMQKRILKASKPNAPTHNLNNKKDIPTITHSDETRHSNNTDEETNELKRDTQRLNYPNQFDLCKKDKTASYSSSSSSSPASPENNPSSETARKNNFSRESWGSSVDKQCSSPHQYRPVTSISDSWNKTNENQSCLSNPVQFYHKEQFQKTVQKLNSLYNQRYFYNGLYAGSQSLNELKYAFNLQAASALGIPQLPLPFLSGYRGDHNPAEQLSLSLSKQLGLHQSETRRLESRRFEPYQRYKLLDWSQNVSPKEANQRSSNAFFSSHFAKDKNSIFLNHSSSQLSPSAHPPSPVYSDQSQNSPISEKRPIPAYFRSSLGGSTSIDEKHCGGKAKKCRRSRTVFTEQQVCNIVLRHFIKKFKQFNLLK